MEALNTVGVQFISPNDSLKHQSKSHESEEPIDKSNRSSSAAALVIPSCTISEFLLLCAPKVSTSLLFSLFKQVKTVLIEDTCQACYKLWSKRILLKPLSHLRNEMTSLISRYGKNDNLWRTSFSRWEEQRLFTENRRDGGIENVDDKIWVPVRISQPLMNFLYSLSIAVANINTPADIMVAAADSSTSKENLDEAIVSKNFFESSKSLLLHEIKCQLKELYGDSSTMSFKPGLLVNHEIIKENCENFATQMIVDLNCLSLLFGSDGGKKKRRDIKTSPTTNFLYKSIDICVNRLDPINYQIYEPFLNRVINANFASSSLLFSFLLPLGKSPTISVKNSSRDSQLSEVYDSDESLKGNIMKMTTPVQRFDMLPLASLYTRQNSAKIDERTNTMLQNSINTRREIRPNVKKESSTSFLGYIGSTASSLLQGRHK